MIRYLGAYGRLQSLASDSVAGCGDSETKARNDLTHLDLLIGVGVHKLVCAVEALVARAFEGHRSRHKRQAVNSRGQ